MGPASRAPAARCRTPAPRSRPRATRRSRRTRSTASRLRTARARARPPSTSSRTAAAPQGDGSNGEFTVFDAPLPVDDAAPTAALSASKTVALKKDSVVYTAIADDDFGVKRVTFYDGVGRARRGHAAAVHATRSRRPKTPSAPTTRSPRWSRTRQGQTASASTPLTVDCSATCRAADASALAARQAEHSGQAARAHKPGRARERRPGRPRRHRVGGLLPRFPQGLHAARPRRTSAASCPRARTSARRRCALSSPTSSARRANRAARCRSGASRRPSLRLTADKLKRTSKTKGWRIQGRLNLPSRVTPAQGCSGRVTLVLKRGSTTLVNQQLSLKKDCTVSKSIRVARRGTYKLTARFEGNSVLLPISANRRLS